MTQKEIDKFLANTKVYVNGKSKEIQEKLFSLGYSWPGDNSIKVINVKEPFLYIYDTHGISCGCNMSVFINSEYREITADEILSLELTEPTYRPFKDKDECWNEMLKHEPFGWCKHKENKTYVNWMCIGDNIIGGVSLDYAYKTYTFNDGTPFGIKED